MTAQTKTVLLIYPAEGRPCMPELADAIRRTGAECKQFHLGQNFAALLDALEENVLPVVVKG